MNSASRNGLLCERVGLYPSRFSLCVKDLHRVRQRLIERERQFILDHILKVVMKSEMEFGHSKEQDLSVQLQKFFKRRPRPAGIKAVLMSRDNPFRLRTTGKYGMSGMKAPEHARSATKCFRDQTHLRRGLPDIEDLGPLEIVVGG